MTPLTCSACGAENEPGRKFCGECGSALTLPCPSCATPNSPTVKFCGECGAPLAAQAVTQPTTTVPPPQAERRLVTVLFADLVGFTSASEGRDAEDTRELLTRYFDTSRQVIERYGGTVDKFIGDAVMAVWGAPLANEDDAERGVRAALELVAVIPGLDSGLRARAGVLTGEAAVSLNVEGQGLVAGDLVNTASRIQSEAEPGQVLVGEATRRSAEASIVFEDAGEHTVKGKSEPLRLWRAARVVGLRRGTVKSHGLEPAFVGRDRELRLVKEIFHTTAEDRKAHLVSVVGIPGIGKSRLAWELDKYVDGLASENWWHSGRCLAYGDGVAFWALADMVRGRSGILEDEDVASARPKLRAALEAHLPDAEERRFVEPRLAHLLGLEEGASGDQENLFAAARMFFERLAATRPTVLLFEDIHWADSALLDFVEYLIEWSRDVPLFVLTLSRPELAERRPSWGAGKRNFTSIFLEPLPPQVMDDLLTGPVPGLPAKLRDSILDRAEGVPFYAVETVRMLLDRGLLVREGNAYHPAGEIGTLEVPETLHALIAARLDGLSGEERRIVQQAAVLGRTFTVRGLAAVSQLSEAELEPLLGSLVRKEFVSLTTDPISPERGQYAFLQDLVKKVAYDTLSRRERKALHLAAAAHLRSLGEEDEIVEVLAAHYVDAYEAEPDDPDAGEIRQVARDALAMAGERAAALAASAEARRLFARAAELSDDSFQRAELHERAGTVAWAGADAEAASEHFEQAMALYEETADTHAAARVSARHAEILWERGRLEDGLERMDRAYAVLSQEEPDADLAALAAQLGRFLFFAGRPQVAMERLEAALQLAEIQLLPEVLSQALNTKALVLDVRGRKEESLLLLRHALSVAVAHDKPSAALRAYYNLLDMSAARDMYDDAAGAHRDGLALARRAGNHYWERALLGFTYPLFALGRWDDVVEGRSSLPADADWREARLSFGPTLNSFLHVNVHRGRLEPVARLVALLDELRTSADVQERAYFGAGAARLALTTGENDAALKLATGAYAAQSDLGFAHDAVKEAFVAAVEAALVLGETAQAEDLLATVERLPAGTQPRFLQAHAARFRGHLASRAGEGSEPGLRFKRSAALLREIGFPFYLGVVLLEHAEWAATRDRRDEAAPLAAEARTIFDELEATPWLERTQRLAGESTVPA